MLDTLEAFLSTFQTDLSSVAGHISDLQGRSRVLDGRLLGRRSVEQSLGPLVDAIAIPPALVDLIFDADPTSEAFCTAVVELEARLTAIRSGPRVAARTSLDGAAEKLRVRAAERIRTMFVEALTPLRTSIAHDLYALQQSVLRPRRPLYVFLQRLAPRQAHEVQKFYVSTAKWYFETGFRRYVRALERIRVRSSLSGSI